MNLEQIRQSKNITLKQIAEGTGLSINTIRTILGLKPPTSQPKGKRIKLVRDFLQNASAQSPGLNTGLSEEKILAALIALLRGEISRKDAAAQAEISYSYFSRIYSGERRSHLIRKAREEVC